MSEVAVRSRFEVGIVVARRSLAGPWASHAWLPRAVLGDAPQVAPWTPLGRDGADELFYLGAAELSLHPGATAHYRDNLASRRASLWVELKSEPDGVSLGPVTADPYEGEAMAELGDIVEALAMPPEIEAGVSAFMSAFHVDRAFEKRVRDRADPEALGRRETQPSRGARDETS